MSTRPANYIKNQMECNFVHRDGSLESANEEARQYAKELCQFLIRTKIVPSSILDIGCRTGYALDTLQEYLPNARIVGVDIVPIFVTVASKRGEVYEADMQALPFADGEFDWVFCTGTIEHAHDPAAACREMFRVAKLGVACGADVAPRREFDKNNSHYTYREGPTDWIKEMLAVQPEHWQLTSLRMPSITVADMMWMSPTLYRQLQERD